MMSAIKPDVLDFYRDTVLRHSRDPHNFRRISPADCEATGHNPLCGDKLKVYVNLDNDSIADLAFEGSGCAISVASASIMTDTIAGLDRNAARRSIDEVINGFTGDDEESSRTEPGPMAALQGVRRYPSRIKCATLAWKTLAAALDATASTVSTE